MRHLKVMVTVKATQKITTKTASTNGVLEKRYGRKKFACKSNTHVKKATKSGKKDLTNLSEKTILDIDGYQHMHMSARGLSSIPRTLKSHVQVRDF